MRWSTSDLRRLQHLAAMLRLSEYLERGRNNIVHDVHAHWDKKQLTLSLSSEDPTVELWVVELWVVELWVAQLNGLDLMESVFGCRVVLERTEDSDLLPPI